MATTTTTTTPRMITIRFKLTDGTTAQDLSMLQVEQTMVTDCRLSQLRGRMAQAADQKEISLLSFCSKTGAVVSDEWLVRDYSRDAAEAELSASTLVLEIYMKKAATKAVGVAPSIEAPKIDLTLPSIPPNATSAQLESLKSTYQAALYTAKASTAAPQYASDLGEQQWSVVVDNNSLCYGNSVIRKPIGGRVTAIGIKRARYPSFEIKTRNIPAYKLTTVARDAVTMSLRIPDYIVDDRSYVSVFQTANSFQASLSNASFSQYDVQAAVSGSAFGFSLGASAGYGQSGSSSSSSAQMQDSKRMNISYNFPRVTLVLDEKTLALTDQCKADLVKVTDQASLAAFLEDYGQFYSTRVQLGGRLYASEEMDTSDTRTDAQAAKAMKASAAVSFGGYGFSGSAGFSTSNSSSNTSASSQQSMTSSLTWEANGGNALLCNNPVEWCSTVSSYNTWRITKQDDIVQLMDLIIKFPGYTTLSALVSASTVPATTTAALQAQLAQPCNFRLQEVNTTNITRYLAVNKPQMISLESLGNIMKSKTGSTAYPTSAFRNMGTVTVKGPADDNANSGSFMTLETNDDAKTPVTEVRYETWYKLVNRTASLYFDMLTIGGQSFPRGSDGTQWITPVKFRNPALATATSRPADTIQSGAQVTVLTGNEDGRYLTLGDAYNTDHSFLMSSVTASGYPSTAIKFTYRPT